LKGEAGPVNFVTPKGLEWDDEKTGVSTEASELEDQDSVIVGSSSKER
jgi:hypothetical protein